MLIQISLIYLHKKTKSLALDWIGLDWIGLDWIGLDWIGLDWIGSFLRCPEHPSSWVVTSASCSVI